MNEKAFEKLTILADAAKYDVSCASSGSKRTNSGGLGNAAKMGICHSFTEDGRCVSLLKILLTNFCIFDCAYCINRRSNDVKRAAFTVEEVVETVIGFYRRNYIEGLFLSSGIFKNADYTMERLVSIARKLRTEHRFNGYIHLKTIPGASEELVNQAGLWADRLSVNIEIPSEASLKKVAPEKTYNQVFQPMNLLKEGIENYHVEKKKTKKAPLFAPAGQSTQLVIGATPENDHQILHLASDLYKDQQLKRVYYSAYVPISSDNRLPALKQPPLVRENRLYQADWLLRFYGFDVNDIVNDTFPELDLQLDPKLAFALRNPHLFPIDLNKDPYEKILKVPGVGVKSAKMIVQARRYGKVQEEHLKKMGVVWKRAQYFIIVSSNSFVRKLEDPLVIKQKLLASPRSSKPSNQLSLF